MWKKTNFEKAYITELNKILKGYECVDEKIEHVYEVFNFVMELANYGVISKEEWQTFARYFDKIHDKLDLPF